jgi:dTDP-glucose 4,6-dehydratase
MKRVLLTGVGGFIGSHCLSYFIENTDWEIIGIDSFRHKGDLGRLVDIDFKNRVKILYHDLSLPINDSLYNQIADLRVDERGNLNRKKINYIINMAADSAVERSTQDPVSCLRNNYELCINMLEFARKIKPEKFVQISTDEVYGEASEGSPGHHEWDVILPSNPYAASKAAQEAVAISYWRSFGVPVIITNTMNIIGEYQDPEKFLPKIIQKISLNQEMPIYGDSLDSIGKRVYLDAKNKADALIYMLKQPVAMYKDGAKRPDRWNICGDTELNNLELAEMVAKIMNKELKYKLIPSESARPGYDRRYALDGSKLRQAGWKQPYTFQQTLERVVHWSVNNPEWIHGYGS